MNPADGLKPASASWGGGKHRTGLFTLLFTDVVGSTQLKAALGDQPGVTLIQSHHALVRELLRSFSDAEEIGAAGDSFLLVFAKPSDALRFALQLRRRLREFNESRPVAVQDRIGLHMGEVVIEEREGKRDVHGMQVDTCARVMSLAQAGQILMTRPVFDNARQTLKGEEITGVSTLEWLNHGRFELKGLGEPVEICEVRAAGGGKLPAPTTSEKARRVEAAEGEAVLGWRPAVGQVVPNTQWVLEEKLGEGGFGEVWLGCHQVMKERRVFKFCFRADRVRSLKREMTLFRMIKERIGDHPNIVALREVYFEQPPFYVEEDYVPSQDLAGWCAAHGGADKVPLESKLELVAQIADALQAAHDAGVIHRDVKPGNILVHTQPGPAAEASGNGHRGILAKLTDFGIGQVISDEALAGITRAGFTQTMFSSSSSHTGTQLYVAPELLAGKPASSRSDIYSLGVVLYQLLLGEFQYPVTTDWGADVSDPLLREDLQRCFAGNPENRFAAAALLARSLRALPQRRAERAKREQARQQAAHRQLMLRASLAVAGGLLVLTGAFGYGFWRVGQERDRAEANAYASDMNLAQQALLAEDVGKARRLLDQYRPGTGREHLRGFEWRYLARQARGDYLAASTNPSSQVFSMALSPDGHTLAVGRWNGLLELWDPVSLSRTAILETNNVYAVVAFSPVGNLLAATGPSGIVRLWQIEPPRIVGTLVYTNPALSLSFSPQGKHLASFHKAIGVRVWDVERQQPIMTFSDFSSYLDVGGEVCFSPDGRCLAIGDVVREPGGTSFGRISILDWAAECRVTEIRAHDHPIMCLAYSPDGKLLASSSGFAADDIRLWKPETGEPAGSLSGHRAWIPSLRFTENGECLLSASGDQTIGVWDVPARRLRQKLRGHLDEVWTLSLDKTTLISGSKDGILAKWDLNDLKSRTFRVDLPGSTWAPAFADSTSSVATFIQGGVVALWPSKNPLRSSIVPALGTNNQALATAPSHNLLACANWEGNIRIYSLSTGNVLTNLSGPARIYVLRFPTKADFLMALDSSAVVTVWDAKSWTKRPPCRETNIVWASALSPDGRLVVMTGPKGLLFWWDAVEGRRLAETAAHRGEVTELVFSPDSRVLASVGEDGYVALWDTRTRREIARWKGFFLGIAGVAFSPDGSRLVTGFNGPEAARLWDWRTQRELITFVTPGDFTTVQFSLDDNALLAGDRDGHHAYLWRAPSFQEIEAWQAHQK